MFSQNIFPARNDTFLDFISMCQKSSGLFVSLMVLLGTQWV
jgi:hypothetical protein